MPDDQFLTLDGRPTVRIERRYEHPIEKVWRAVTAPEHLGEWFPSPVEVDLRPGGAMRFGAFDGDAAAHGTVEALDPPHLLTFTWGTDRLTFELAPDGDGTRFALTHCFDDRAGAASFATGWEQSLAGLRHVLAGEPLPPPDRGRRGVGDEPGRACRVRVPGVVTQAVGFCVSTNSGRPTYSLTQRTRARPRG